MNIRIPVFLVLGLFALVALTSFGSAYQDYYGYFGDYFESSSFTSSLSMNNKDSMIATSSKGQIVRVSMKDLRVMGRATQGVRIVKLKEGDKVADVVKVPVAEVVE